MNEERKRGGLFGRLARGLRSSPAAKEAGEAPAVQHPAAPLPENAAVPPGANDLINEGKRRREQSGAAAALPLFEQAAKLAPNSYLPFFMLGNTATDMQELDLAVTYFERARDLEPNMHVIPYNLGLIHLWRGYIECAIQELRTACRLKPSYEPAQSGFIMALHNSDLVSPEEIANASRGWAARFELQHPATAPSAAPDRTYPRKLRVGFVS